MNSKKHTLSRKVLATLLTAAMLITMLPSAMFANGDSGIGQSTAVSDDYVTIDKTATAGSEPGTWDVTLTVTPKEKDISQLSQEVVLVLDTSSSMNEKISNSNKTRWQVLQSVLTEKDGLIDTFAKAGTKLAVVLFASHDQVDNLTQGFVDLNDVQNVSSVKAKINATDFGDDRGTDIYAGLSEALEMLEGSTASNPSVILLSDGACDIDFAKYGYKNYSDKKNIYTHSGEIDPVTNLGQYPHNVGSSHRPKQSNNYSYYMGLLDQSANSLQDKASLYSISFASSTDSNGYKTLDRITEDGKLYSSSDYEGLKANFEEIANKILPMVDDPMGDEVKVVDGTIKTTLNSQPTTNAVVIEDSNGDQSIRWNPKSGQSLEAGDTLTITYTVQLKDKSEENLKKLYGDDGSTLIPLNDEATLNYAVEGSDGSTTLAFPVPKGTVEVGKLVETIYLDGQPQANPTVQYALVGDNFTWDAPNGSISNSDGTFLYQESQYDGLSIESNVQTKKVDNAGSHTLGHYYNAEIQPPTGDEVIKALGNEAVTIDCVNTRYTHENVKTGLIDGTFDIGEVTENNDTYQVVVTVNPDDADAYADYYNKQEAAGGKMHSLVENQQSTTITLTYNNEQDKWEAPTDYTPIVVNVKCPDPADLDAFNKEVVTGPVEGITGNYAYPVENTVNANEGDQITLLYKITVSGDAGAEFTVTDEDATLVKGEGITEASGAFSGTIPDGGTSEFYVSKEFDIESGTNSVSNTASVKNNDSDGDNPDPSQVTVVTDVDVTHVYGITGIEKFYVNTETDAKTAGVEQTDKYTFVEDGKNVVIPYGGKVTLLYGITVTGEKDEAFTVKDEGATLVSTNSTNNSIQEDNGTFTGSIPADGSITFYVEKEFEQSDIEDNKLSNTAIVTNGDVDPDKKQDTEDVPAEGAAQTFTLTYNANGGKFGSEDEPAVVGGLTAGTITLWTKNASDNEVKPEGKDFPTHEKAAPDENSQSVDVVFMGWTTSTDAVGKIYKAGESYPETTLSVEFPTQEGNNGETVYAVWGYDTNGDGIADATQVMVIPADITIYSGGTGYGGVTDKDGNFIGSTATTGLPEPGYYFILPASANIPGGTDLSATLKFENGDNDTWTVNRLGVYDVSAETSAPNRYVYRINAENTTKDPVHLIYFDDVDNNGRYDDSDKVISTDDISMAVDTVNVTHSMTINSDDLNSNTITTTLNGKEYSVGVGTGTLTVKSTVNQENNTSNIASNINDVNADAITAVADNITYYVNDSEVEVNNDNDRVQLLVDKISNSDDYNEAIENDAMSKADLGTDNVAAESAYMDLVDSENGNTVITMDDGDKMTILWPAPENAASDSKYQIIHYTEMNRLTLVGEDELNNANYETIEGKLVTYNGKNYIEFQTGSFSPFVLVYETKDTTGGGGTTGGGTTPTPPALNTEDHFSYVVGYEDGMVKPENAITRAEVASIFYRLLKDDVRDANTTDVSEFSDVSASDWYGTTVATLSAMDIVRGYEDGTFRPNAPITRAEFAAIATRFFEETGAEYEPGTFDDVTGDEWFANAIADAVELGLIGGYPDGTVRPNNNITRAEACAVVNRTLGRIPHVDHLLPADEMTTWPDNNPGDWFYADMQEATNGHEYEWTTEQGQKVEEWTEILDKDWNDR